MSCCKSKDTACADADNQVLICQVGTATTQTIIQLNKIRYTSVLPGEAIITAVRVLNVGSWLPAFKDSNGNAPPLNVEESYCVKNVSCRIAKFAINIDGVDLLPPVSLTKNAFVVFTADAASIRNGDFIFGVCCPETTPNCSKRAPVSNYNGGRSPGVITCSLPQQKRQIPSFRVADSCSCSNCN